MAVSILESVKKAVNVGPNDTAFDSDIIMHINSTFADLTQIGIGPDDGYMIEDATPTWEDYLGTNKHLNSVQSYMFLRVRRLFDPPGTPHHLNAMDEEIKKFEWRLNLYRESIYWVDPNPDLEPGEDEEVVILDGGVL
jgi:hypothetical protein